LKKNQNNLEKYTDHQLFDLEEEIRIKEGLPFLLGFKWYKWQIDYINSVNRDNFIVAANQIGKSCCNVAKCINWATNKKLWPSLWEKSPLVFLYFYPSIRLATVEFENKWVKELLPKGDFKTHPIYGWEEQYKNKEINCIRFNSGVTVYFLSYSQSLEDIQAMTVWAVFADEEMPEEFYPEIQARLRATRGYFHMVFTATLGQEMWRCAMEEHGQLETFRKAYKRQISMYDCLYFADGKKSWWTKGRIAEEISRCGTDAEVQRRIFGRFVRDEGLKYPTFDRSKHVIKPFPIPHWWRKYAAIDFGSGGKNHKAAIVFIAINEDSSKGYLYKCWRGDDQITTTPDILNKFIEMRDRENLAAQYYDWANVDFSILSQRAGECFIKADKNNETGTQVLNTLFKNDMLFIFDDMDGWKLANELAGMYIDGNKRQKKDDLIDATRYCAHGIPWDFSKIMIRIDEIVEKAMNLNDRDQIIYNKMHNIKDKARDNEIFSIESELEEANDFYEHI